MRLLGKNRRKSGDFIVNDHGWINLEDASLLPALHGNQGFGREMSSLNLVYNITGGFYSFVGY